VLALLSSASGGNGQADGQHRSAIQTPTIGPAARVYPPSSNYRFPDGETYVYSVEWHMFNAGIAHVTMDAVGTQQRVTAIADSLGVVNLMYTVHDRWESYFDPRTFCSQKIVKHAAEGKRRRDSDVQFDYGRHKVVRIDKDLGTGESKRLESDVPACVTDVVTGFYYLASQSLAVGSSYTFPINDAGKTTDVSAQVDTTEQVKVPAGNYQAVRITAQPISGPLKGKAKVAAWFSNDANHIPLQMRAKLGWGTLFFRLQRVEKK
jgi:uncharacterized protein DUF3108